MKENKFESILNLYNHKYEFRFCKKEEVERLTNFLDQYWKKNHILVTSRKLLDWQYFDQKNNRYNFIFAIEKKSNQIHGILGFITSDFYDPEIKTPIRWGTIWKVRDEVASKGLGLALKLFMYQNVITPYSGGIGLSRFSKEINRKMGEEMGVLSHYFILNPNKKEYKLASCGQILKSKIIDKIPNSDQTCTFEECKEEQFKKYFEYDNKDIIAFKSVNYYCKRFFEHPIYQYHCVIIHQQKDPSMKAAFFYRIAKHEDNCCIFLVDYVGEEKALIGASGAFTQLLERDDAEYLSFYEYGLTDSILKKSGLRNVLEEDVVIPLYYEPFEQINVELDYHYYNSDVVNEAKYFFKGDADQDRPNFIEEN